jgi:hypothetical protein
MRRRGGRERGCSEVVKWEGTSHKDMNGMGRCKEEEERENEWMKRREKEERNEKEVDLLSPAPPR